MFIYTMSNNPLANFSALSFMEKRKQEEEDEHNGHVVWQAGEIQKNIKVAKLSNGYVVLPPSTIINIYPENLQHLKKNGFRVWSITETTKEYTRDLFHVTWDCNDFKKYYEEYVKNCSKHNLFLKSSYKEVI